MKEKANSTTGAPIRVRLATEADRARLIPLVNSAFSIETFLEGTRTDEERLAATMRKGEILLAELAADDQGSEPVGCIYTEVRGERGYLGMLAVDPARQGTGLAGLIVHAAEEHLRRRGCTAVDIGVLSLRPELLPLYRRFGFVETGREEFIFSRALKPGAECHCIVMSKPL
jgi:ribosomal protein S18 acetylase RimI-like enzyme